MKVSTAFSLCLVTATELAGVLAATSVHVKRAAVQQPSALPIPGQPSSAGCWSSGANMTKVSKGKLSSSSCLQQCTPKGYLVAGLYGSECLCGWVLPPANKVEKDLTKCNFPCNYYPQEACGGIEGPTYWSIWYTGVSADVSNQSPPKPSSSSSSSSKHSSKTKESTSSATSSTTVETGAVTTLTETATAPPSQSNDSDEDNKKGGGSGTNVGAIAGGVVVGVVVVLLAIGGGFLLLRRKRNAEIEEEHRRNAAVNAFISGSKPPSSNGSVTMTDSRLDPVMAHRRLSDGSIADNQDYSRKILRVTNA